MTQNLKGVLEVTINKSSGFWNEKQIQIHFLLIVKFQYKNYVVGLLIHNDRESQFFSQHICPLAIKVSKISGVFFLQNFLTMTLYLCLDFSWMIQMKCVLRVPHHLPHFLRCSLYICWATLFNTISFKLKSDMISQLYNAIFLTALVCGIVKF